MRKHSLLVALVLLPVVAMSDTHSSDERLLATLVEEFLSASHTRAAHERFWSDELVYTSSSGSRFGKADILAGFSADPGNEESEVAVVYSGKDIDVRIYGTAAVVAFMLIGTPADESADMMYFYNTGTFAKRAGEWRAVAWQATKIPPGN